MATAIPELPEWFARLAHPRRRQRLAASDRKVPVVTTQSRNPKEQLIRNGRMVAFHVFSLFDITNGERNLQILFFHVLRVRFDDCFHIAYSHENTYLLHFVDVVCIDGMISTEVKFMQIGVQILMSFQRKQNHFGKLM
jgi:hypothetical protein